tara:strand:+ start:406 stop:783 length:378 start_codon:yes stop_codon:yes gene_type:complete
MSECKTVTYEGNVYQIGKAYAFSDEGKEWEYDILVGFNEGRLYPFIGEIDVWQLVRAIEPSRLGTITPESIKLIDGGAYMFNPHNTKLLDVIGLYEENNNRFYFNGKHVDLAYCSLIRLMAIEKK